MVVKLVEYKLKALWDANSVAGEPLIKEGKTYNAVRADSVLLIDANGVTLFETMLGDTIDGFEVISREEIESLEDSTIDSISYLMKRRNIEKWFEENVIPESIVTVKPKLDCCVPNSAGPNAGSEWFNKDESMIGVINEDGEIMIQRRKGVIFYIGEEYAHSFTITRQICGELNISYATMKEIKYIIDNDYKKNLKIKSKVFV